MDQQFILICYLLLFSNFYCLKLKTNLKTNSPKGFSISLKKLNSVPILSHSFMTESQETLDNSHQACKILK